jgi:hypothetical protein
VLPGLSGLTLCRDESLIAASECLNRGERRGDRGTTGQLLIFIAALRRESTALAEYSRKMRTVRLLFSPFSLCGHADSARR